MYRPEVNMYRLIHFCIDLNPNKNIVLTGFDGHLDMRPISNYMFIQYESSNDDYAQIRMQCTKLMLMFKQFMQRKTYKRYLRNISNIHEITEF